MLKSGSTTWRVLEEKYSKELEMQVTRANIKNLAERLEIEVKVLKISTVRKGTIERNKIMLALCKTVDFLCTNLGEDEAPGLVEIRKYLSDRINTTHVYDELPHKIK